MNKEIDPKNIQAHWEASMRRRLDELKASIQQLELYSLAQRCGAKVIDSNLQLNYWNRPIRISWPDLTTREVGKAEQLSIFDTTLLFYYLHTADGSPLEYRWVSLRELPGGAFYHQAFQGYSGDRMAKFFSKEPGSFQRAAQFLNGIQLTGLGEYAYAFQPLPRLRLAAIFWPGDEEFAARGSILFDATSIHYMVLDGLTVLGSRLVSKLTKLL